MTDTSALAACPFCLTDTAELRPRSKKARWYRIHCTHCLATGPLAVTWGEARAMWNVWATREFKIL